MIARALRSVATSAAALGLAVATWCGVALLLLIALVGGALLELRSAWKRGHL